jgi:hypothetical protein
MDDVNKRVDNVDKSCCGCEETVNPAISGDCPGSLEHMTNWRTEHTRIRLPEDNFAFPVETQKINPNDCNCDPVVESCCTNLDDLPDKIYANFYVDTAIGNQYPLLKPQEGRLGQFHFYSPTAVGGFGGPLQRYFSEQGRIAPSCFVFSLDAERIDLGEERQGINRGVKFDLKQILETVGGSLDEDLRYCDKFTVELLRDRTFDSSRLPQNISDVRHIHDLKEQLGREAANYREYYLAECPPTGTVISKKPYLDIITDTDPCAYAQLRAVDCVPKMVWTAKVRTPGDREIQIVYFCDGKDSATGANTFKTMIFHLDSIKNEWGSFKERDFWNLFEKFEPDYDETDWWLWHKERDWSRFLGWELYGDQWYLDPNQDYRVLQDINYIFTVGYIEWIWDETVDYYYLMGLLCKHFYAEYCSPRGFFVPPGGSFQLDAPFQATTVRQASPFFEVDQSGVYNPLDSNGKVLVKTSFAGIGGETYLGRCNYHTLLNPSLPINGIKFPPHPWVWDDDWQAANYPQGYPYPYINSEGFTQWSFESLARFSKGPKLGTVKSSGFRTFNPYPTSADDYKCEWDVSWTKSERIDTVYKLFASTHKRANYPFGVLYPEKAPLLLKLYGNGNCPYIQPSKFRGFSKANKVDFTIHSAVNGVLTSHKAHAECVVYKPYYPPAFWKCDIRYTLNDLPVEEQPARAKIHCPKLPEEFLDANHKPIAEFPNGKYPMHLFATVSKDFIKASGRNNQRHKYFADDWDPYNKNFPPNEKTPLNRVLNDFYTPEILDNVSESGGADYFTPKELRGKYTDLFYRLDFLGAKGPPENLSLHYGKWYNDEQSRWETARFYYNTPSHLLWTNTPQLFDDIEVIINVTATNSAGTISVYSPSETKTGYPGGHRFTGQDIECPYISFPLIVNKDCDTYTGPDCDYFPYYSPIGELSTIDTGKYAPGVITLAPKGGFQLVIKTHSDSWSRIREGEFESGWDYIKCGFNNPYYGTYINGTMYDGALGVLGGQLRFRGVNSDTPNIEPPRLDVFDCDESDLQALFLEGSATFPYSQAPFPNLNPPPDYCNGSTKPFYANYVDGLYPNADSYAAAGGSLFPFRKQLNFWPSPSVPCRIQAIKNLWFGEQFYQHANPNDNVTFSVTYAHWSIKNTSAVYSDFIYNDVESPPGLYYVWNAARTLVTTIILKAPNITQATEMYYGQAYWENLVADNIAYVKANFEEPFIRGNVDTEGTMPPLYHQVNYGAQAPSSLKQIQTYDTCEGYVTGGDGQPHPYTREYTVLNGYDPITLIPSQNWTYVNETRTLSEITVPKYIYPHEYYFKCTISS